MLHAKLLALLLTLTTTGVSGAAAYGWRGARTWPIPIEINLSSSFGEYRSGHLHAGVDIRTFGREGIECVAVGDGFVSRMRASSSGYGKALYLKLASGETVVYAHLAEFAPELEEELHATQLGRGAYKVDVYFDAERFPVRQGDVIGYTGSTGTSAPHLHFEVRDERENPLNPLSVGWELEDNEAAAFGGAVWIPLSTTARIDGSCAAHDSRLRHAGGNHYVAADTVCVTGRVGIGVKVVDRINASSGRLAPYRVEMTVDGVLLASITLESFTYGHTDEVELAYEMERVRSESGYYLLLFRRRGETLWHRTFVNDGVIDGGLIATLVGEPRASYEVIVRATDRAGNVATASLPFTIDSDPGAKRPVAKPRHERVPGCYFFGDVVAVQPDKARFGLVTKDGVEVYPGSAQLAFNVDDLYRDIAEPTSGISGTPHNGHGAGMHAILPLQGPRRYVFPLRAGEREERRLDDIGIIIDAGEGTLYADAILYGGRWVGPEPSLGRTGAPYRKVTPSVELGPLSLALRKPLELRFTALDAGADRRAAVYRLDEEKKAWRYESSEVRGEEVVAQVGGPGVYAVLVDTETPRIGKPLIAKRRSYATGALSPEIVIPIEDDGCGVDEGRTIVRVDGRETIGRWDGFAGKMYVPLRDMAHSNTYRVAVEAYDRVGNEAKIDTRVDTRK